MYGISPSHLILLSFIILLFGARRLPELGQALGETFRALRKALEQGADAKADEAPGRDAAHKAP